MILYLIQLSAIWTILLIAFYLLYKNQTYHNFNRWYILLSLLAGVIIPLLPTDSIHHKVAVLATGYHMINMIAVINSTVAATGNNFMFNLILIIWIIYFSLVIFKIYQTIKELLLYVKITKQKQVLAEHVFIQYTETFQQPFSFFNIIVLPKSLEHDLDAKGIIIEHELIHIKYKHFYDLIMLKILEIILPYHPCLYFFKKELILIHEYQADQVAIQQTNEDAYTRVLIQFMQKPFLKSSMVHTFYYSPIKSRIMMLFKKSSGKQYLYLAPFLFIACTYLNQDSEKVSSKEKENTERSKHEIQIPLPNIIKGDTTISHSDATIGDNEYLPKFPGGEKELMEFLAKNIRYPEHGKNKGIQGTTFVKFEINEDGSIHNKIILRSLGDEFDQEMFRVMNLMPNWIPAENKEGKKMKESYTLPVKFKLSN